MRNISNDRNIDIAWTRISQAVIDRDIAKLTKYFFWLRKLINQVQIKYPYENQ